MDSKNSNLGSSTNNQASSARRASPSKSANNALGLNEIKLTQHQLVKKAMKQNESLQQIITKLENMAKNGNVVIYKTQGTIRL